MKEETIPTAGLQVETFYRVCHDITQQGLWYSTDGAFTGLIHEQLSFCANNKLEMPYDAEIVGYLSATKTIEELLLWFPLEDIKRLEDFGFFITEYQATDYKLYKNHWVIDQGSSVVVKVVPVAGFSPAPLSEQKQEGETTEQIVNKLTGDRIVINGMVGVEKSDLIFTINTLVSKCQHSAKQIEERDRYISILKECLEQAKGNNLQIIDGWNKQIDQYKARIDELEERVITRDKIKASRNWTEDFSHENGNYNNICMDCESVFVGHKRRVQCKLCASIDSEGQYKAKIKELEAENTSLSQRFALYVELKNSNHIGAQFKLMRKEKGYTLRQLEDATGISNAYLSQLETGKVTNPSYTVVSRLIDFLVDGKAIPKDDNQF